MKITTVETKLDVVEFLLLQPSVVRSLSEQVGYGAAVPENCKAVVACHVFRPGDPDADGGGTADDIYIRGFAFCAGEDQFCVVKGMKIALEDAAKEFRKLGLESPWRQVIESHIKDALVGDNQAVYKMNSDIRRRLQFDPYRIDTIRTGSRDWAKRKKAHKVTLVP